MTFQSPCWAYSCAHPSSSRRPLPFGDCLDTFAKRLRRSHRMFALKHRITSRVFLSIVGFYRALPEQIPPRLRQCSTWYDGSQSAPAAYCRFQPPAKGVPTLFPNIRYCLPPPSASTPEPSPERNTICAIPFFIPCVIPIFEPLVIPVAIPLFVQFTIPFCVPFAIPFTILLFMPFDVSFTISFAVRPLCRYLHRSLYRFAVEVSRLVCRCLGWALEVDRPKKFRHPPKTLLGKPISTTRCWGLFSRRMALGATGRPLSFTR